MTGGRSYWLFRETVPMDHKTDPVDHSRGNGGSCPPSTRPPEWGETDPGDSPDQRAAQLTRALEQIERNATRHNFVPTPVDVARVRRRLGMTQTQFAGRFGLPVATLRHWEGGQRKPAGAALVLLHIIDRIPQAALRALRPRLAEAWEGHDDRNDAPGGGAV